MFKTLNDIEDLIGSHGKSKIIYKQILDRLEVLSNKEYHYESYEKITSKKSIEVAKEILRRFDEKNLFGSKMYFNIHRIESGCIMIEFCSMFDDSISYEIEIYNDGQIRFTQYNGLSDKLEYFVTL